MGFFNWLLAKPAAKANASMQTDIHASLQDATRPFTSKGKSGANPNAVLQPAANSSAQRLEQRRSERNARRELLFQVVRESMVRVGVLSSAFKFKVLALDQRGQTFLVMVDLSAEFAGETDKLAEIEALISQSAKNRFDLAVQAVYWRFYDTAASNSISRSQAAGGMASAPAPLFGLSPQARAASVAGIPAPLFSLPPQTGKQAARPFDVTQALQPSPVRSNTPAPIAPNAALSKPFAPSVKPSAGAVPDPLDTYEVEAFKRALASGAQPGLSIPLGRGTPAGNTAPAATPAIAPRAAAASLPNAALAAALSAAPTTAAIAAAASASKAAAMAAIHNKLLLTGYEDTEMPDPDAPVLSPTQYGDLH